MRLKQLQALAMLFWMVAVSLSFMVTHRNAQKEQARIALVSARSFFDHIVITRLWNARHGGLYAPVTAKTRPNAYLDVPNREIKVSDTLTLTLINPAFMTRQISEIAAERNGVQFHITSLRPIRPENMPTTREAAALRAFEGGLKERAAFLRQGGKTSHFYMAPLVTKKSCLSCHGKQGYRLGDIRGGISVTSPVVMKVPFLALLLTHLGIGGLGLLIICVAGRSLRRAYEVIREQAVLDALTGVPNRRSFSDSILTEFKRSQRHKQALSVIMCDVDHFKGYNDTYGHVMGDSCLQKVAQAVKSSIRRPGDFCARYGGEEFVVLLPSTDLAGARHVAELIRQAVEGLGIVHEASSCAKVVTLSLGVATADGAELGSYEDLVKLADEALYRAKDQGRNRVEPSGDAEADGSIQD